MKYRVALIYAPSDEAVAASVCKALRTVGMKCEYSWASRRENTEGQNFRTIDTSHVIVLILSDAVRDSIRINKEVERASNDDKAIITFRIDNTPLSKDLEFYLSTTQWLDASSPALEKHIAELALNVRKLLAGRKPRASTKSKAAFFLGLLSLIINLFGLPALILGILELRSIRAGRSLPQGRKYALISVAIGSLAFISWGIAMFRWWYWGINPAQDLIDWIES